MTPPLPNWERCESVEDVTIPSPDGKTIAKTIQVKVPAWRDPDDGEIFLDGDSIRIIDDARARAMGLLTTEDLKALRMTLGLTQRRLSQLLKIGEKTWTRWESGRDRPSKSLNVMICALRDGKIDVPYLERLASGQGEVKEAPTVKFGKDPEQLWQLLKELLPDFDEFAGKSWPPCFAKTPGRGWFLQPAERAWETRLSQPAKTAEKGDTEFLKRVVLSVESQMHLSHWLPAARSERNQIIRKSIEFRK